jgi:hypothetical protein
MAQPRRPQISHTRGRGVEPGALELGQAGDPLAIVRMHPVGQLRVKLGVQGLRPPLRDLALDLVADLDPHRRVQLHLRQGGAHVEAGAPDHDRAPPLRQQRVNLAPGQIREPTGAELFRYIGDPDQPMIEACTFGVARGAREHL